jgi:hypothetical protein
MIQRGVRQIPEEVRGEKKGRRKRESGEGRESWDREKSGINQEDGRTGRGAE